MATGKEKYIEIVSKRAGFRRGGIEHPDQPVLHETGSFTAAQLAQILAEPTLVVRDVAEVQEPQEADLDKKPPGGPAAKPPGKTGGGRK
jgi:hypothetical protein